MALIVEVLDGRGGVRARVRVDALPLRIGRALRNDLILDDPWVDAEHARITDDGTGAMVVEDAGSVNGIVPGGTSTRVATVPALPGTEFRLGRTVLRLRDSDEPVPPALRVDAPGHRVVPRWATTGRGQLALCIAAAAAFGIQSWLGSTDRSAAADTFVTVLGLALIGTAWAGLWSVAGRIIVHRFRFLAHLALLCAALIIGLALAAAAEWIAFIFPDDPISPAAGLVLGLVLFAALLVGHLGLATTLPARRRWLSGAIASSIILALVAIAALTDPDTFTDVPEFAGTIKVPAARWIPMQSTTDFAESAASLREDVEALLRK